MLNPSGVTVPKVDDFTGSNVPPAHPQIVMQAEAFDAVTMRSLLPVPIITDYI